MNEFQIGGVLGLDPNPHNAHNALCGIVGCLFRDGTTMNTPSYVLTPAMEIRIETNFIVVAVRSSTPDETLSP